MVFHQEGPLDPDTIELLKSESSFDTTWGTYFLTSLSLYPAGVEVESQWHNTPEGFKARVQASNDALAKAREEDGQYRIEKSTIALDMITNQPKGVKAIRNLKKILSELETQGDDPKTNHREQVNNVQRYLDTIENTQFEIQNRTLTLFYLMNQFGNPNATALIRPGGVIVLDRKVRDLILNQIEPEDREVFAETYNYISKEFSFYSLPSTQYSNREEQPQDYSKIGVTNRIWAEDAKQRSLKVPNARD